MERIFFFFSMTAGFCSNIYLVNMYDHVVLNEKSRICVKLLNFDGCICYFLLELDKVLMQYETACTLGPYHNTVEEVM